MTLLYTPAKFFRTHPKLFQLSSLQAERVTRKRTTTDKNITFSAEVITVTQSCKNLTWV